MSESKVRHLVLKRHPKAKGHFVVCDEETGLPLAGQTLVQLNSSAYGGTATVTVTFDAFGSHGIRLAEDEPRITFNKENSVKEDNENV
ncbi:hypothetical protein [Acinetobacter pittii]|uniref:hypothetical protein n=1 Tax=Acinetobacter pittii TaxID=48296 RepID=UPI00083930A8|nr:hypothetical protein [Acinetobacter pittii]OCY53733.1 hypothetical protein BFR81_04200 [Acinetobacter pittii]